ncbi:MAG TPA: aspartate kinase [Candidatus Dormibacteraeota bacterium]|nr:aspartate kinase [Candidatus Dormibacteraeota bacterium]
MNAHTPALRVMKFGGTSVGDPDRMAATAAIIRQQAAQGRLVVVVSAMQQVTASLVAAAAAASRRETEAWQTIGEELMRRHQEVCQALVSAAERPTIQAQLDLEMSTFKDFCVGFSLVRELTPRSLDSLSSLGEVMSATLVAAALRASGLDAEAVDATEVIVTDDGFGNAALLFEPTNEKVRQRLGPLLQRGSIPVVTGFRAATIDGSCTTLGRGGSDYSATILGAAIPATEIWIWTDVDGMMTADPRLVPEARVIPELSYREAIELSFFGARVLHPKALDLPFLAGIPVLIKNSFNPAAPGTEIGRSKQRLPGVRAIASTSEASLFTVSGTRSMPFTRLAAQVFGALDADRISTLVVTQSSAENVISFVVNSADAARVRRRLERERGTLRGGTSIAAVEELPDVGVVVAVGEGMKGTPGIAARIFSSIARLGINIAAIAQGSSELSVSLVVQASDIPAAVRATHQEFGL